MPRRPTQSDWNAFHDRATRSSNALMRNYANGHLSHEDLAVQFPDLLSERHARAAYLGRSRGGDFSPYDHRDIEIGQQTAESEKVFYDDFLHDLTTSKYRLPDGSWDLDAMEGRAGMYVERMRGTANETFAATSEPDDLLDWVTSGRNKQPCDLCEENAAGGPYRSDDLPGHPCDGQSCRGITKCHCRLVRQRDGIGCFESAD